MVRFVGFVSAALVFTAALSPPAMAQSGQKLDAKEIMALMSGAKLKGVNRQGNKFEADLASLSDADGKAGIEARSGSARDKGNWWAKNDEYCRKLNRFDSKRTRCYSIYKAGNKIEFLEDGVSVDMEFRD